MIVDLNEAFYFPNIEYGNKIHTKEKLDKVLDEFFWSYDNDIKKILEVLSDSKKKAIKDIPEVPGPTPLKDILNDIAGKEVFGDGVDKTSKKLQYTLNHKDSFETNDGYPKDNSELPLSSGEALSEEVKQKIFVSALKEKQENFG